jgi:succinate dehydrogenase / fumarate reductase, flavoprotein subunit
MGGLWVDDELMTNLRGLHVVGEVNFADHVANRLGLTHCSRLVGRYFVAGHDAKL